VEEEPQSGARPSFGEGRAEYTALSLGNRLEKAGIVPSMGRVGSALDNAVSESVVATLKVERVHRRRFPSKHRYAIS
jgi:transposase InsO family protein